MDEDFTIFDCTTIGEFDIVCELPDIRDGEKCGWMGHVGPDKEQATPIIQGHWETWTHRKPE